MFSLFSVVNSSFLTGESWNFRFSRFEAAFTRVSVMFGHHAEDLKWMMQVASIPVSMG